MKYAIVVAFSDEDEGYIATVPELLGCSAFGDTEEDAIREVKIAASLWLSAATKAGRKAPEPIVEKRSRGGSRCAFPATCAASWSWRRNGRASRSIS